MNRLVIGTVCFVFAGAASATPLDSFWSNLQALCGKAYAGELIVEPEGESSFAGRELVMHVRECSDERIRIPFFVGDDRSRTWVLTRLDRHGGARLELKHDHRHEDGGEDEVTMYGGTTTNTGLATQQVFPADQHTRTLIEPAHSNVWRIELLPGDRFSYHLRRLGTERVFQIDFSLGIPIETPEPPWGWGD